MQRLLRNGQVAEVWFWLPLSLQSPIYGYIMVFESYFGNIERVQIVWRLILENDSKLFDFTKAATYFAPRAHVQR